ncbi:unnamed protein product, partial [Ectocarpus sp. 12 AP-2014]
MYWAYFLPFPSSVCMVWQCMAICRAWNVWTVASEQRYDKNSIARMSRTWLQSNKRAAFGACFESHDATTASLGLLWFVGALCNRHYMTAFYKGVLALHKIQEYTHIFVSEKQDRKRLTCRDIRHLELFHSHRDKASPASLRIRSL